MESDEISVYVSSWDGYSWIWDSFFFFLDKHWPDLDFPIFLSTNNLTYSHKNLRVLKTGNINNWSEMLLKNLKQIKSEYILYLQDDFLLKGPICNNRILQALNKLKKLQGVYLKLNDREIHKWIGSKFSVSPITDRKGIIIHLQAAIWKKSKLEELIRLGETPWEFEKNASKRAAQISTQFYQSSKKIVNYYYSGAIHHGKLFILSNRRLNKHGMHFDRKNIMNLRESTYYHLNAFYDKLPFETLIPKVLKSLIKNTLLEK